MQSNKANEKNELIFDRILGVLSNNQNKLEEILIWLKINGIDKVGKLLYNNLDTPEKKLVYHLSDGKSIRDISSSCGISISTISNYWKKWYQLGLMRKIKVQGGGERHFKNFDLDDFDIKVPTTSKKSNEDIQKIDGETVTKAGKLT